MPKTQSKAPSSDSDSGPEDRNAKKSNNEAASSKSKKSGGGGHKNSDDLMWNLGKNRNATLTEFKGKWYVDIRESYMSNEGDMKPGKKGIMLTLEQWRKLSEAVSDINDSIKKHV